MGRLSLLGTTPEVGTPIECRIQVREIEHTRVSVDAELVRPDGRVWMQIRDWQDWRFYWPARYRDVFRAPDTILLGEELPSRDTTAAGCRRRVARSARRHGPSGLEGCSGTDPACSP